MSDQEAVEQNQQEQQKIIQGEDTNESRDISQAVLVMLFLLMINEMLLYVLNRLKQKWKIFHPIQPTLVTTFIGLLAGGMLNILSAASKDVHIISSIQSSFTSFFMIVLLPPILYESAINMERIHFFKNFGSILALAVIGTIVATLLTSVLIYWIAQMGIIEFSLNTCFAFGSLISATDPVAVLSIFRSISIDPTINILIFGESTLNDAVSMQLYETTYDMRGKVNQSYGGLAWESTKHFMGNFMWSVTIGIMIGVISAYMLKKDNKKSLNREITILICIPWASYLIASMLEMSGILSIMFCGISMARYALPNLSSTGKKVNKRFYHTLAHNFENLVFLFIGIGIVAFDLPWKKMGFVFFILAFIVINLARFVNLIIVSYFLNKYRIRHPINNVTKFLLWFSGFRGAMAYALALQSTTQFPENQDGEVMLTITLTYAVINIFFHGSILELVLGKLNLKENQELQKLERYDGFWNNIRDMAALFDQNILQKILIEENQNQTIQHDDLTKRIAEDRNLNLDDIQSNNQTRIVHEEFDHDKDFEIQFSMDESKINDNAQKEQMKDNLLKPRNDTDVPETQDSSRSHRTKRRTKNKKYKKVIQDTEQSPGFSYDKHSPLNTD